MKLSLQVVLTFVSAGFDILQHLTNCLYQEVHELDRHFPFGMTSPFRSSDFLTFDLCVTAKQEGRRNAVVQARKIDLCGRLLLVFRPHFLVSPDRIVVMKYFIRFYYMWYCCSYTAAW